MSRIVRLLKSARTRSLEEELRANCSKCSKRLATDKDGFCDPCRFSDILTQMAEKR